MFEATPDPPVLDVQQSGPNVCPPLAPPVDSPTWQRHVLAQLEGVCTSIIKPLKRWYFSESPSASNVTVPLPNQPQSVTETMNPSPPSPSTTPTNMTHPQTRQIVEPPNRSPFQPSSGSSSQSDTRQQQLPSQPGTSSEQPQIDKLLGDLPFNWEHLIDVGRKAKQRRKVLGLNTSGSPPSPPSVPVKIIDYAHGAPPPPSSIPTKERSLSPYDPSFPTTSPSESSSSDEEETVSSCTTPSQSSSSTAGLTNRIAIQELPWGHANSRSQLVVDLAKDDSSVEVVATNPKPASQNNIVRVFDCEAHFKKIERKPAIVNMRWEHMRKLRGEEVVKVPTYRQVKQPSSQEVTKILCSRVLYNSIPTNVNSHNSSKPVQQFLLERVKPKGNSKCKLHDSNRQRNFHGIPQVNIPQCSQSLEAIVTHDEHNSSTTSSKTNNTEIPSKIPVLKHHQVSKLPICHKEKQNSASSSPQKKDYLYTGLKVPTESNPGLNQIEISENNEENLTTKSNLEIISDINSEASRKTQVKIPLPSQPSLAPDVLFDTSHQPPISSAQPPLSQEGVLNKGGVTKPATIKYTLQQYMERERAKKASDQKNNPKNQQIKSVEESQSSVLKYSKPSKIPASKKQTSVVGVQSEQQLKEVEKIIPPLPEFSVSGYQNPIPQFPQNTTYPCNPITVPFGYPPNYMYPQQQNMNYPSQMWSSQNMMYNQPLGNSTFVNAQQIAMQQQQNLMYVPNPMTGHQGNSSFIAPNLLPVPPKVAPAPSNSRDPRKKSWQVAENKNVNNQSMTLPSGSVSLLKKNQHTFGESSLTNGKELVVSQTKQSETGVQVVSHTASKLKPIAKTSSLIATKKSNPTGQKVNANPPILLPSLEENHSYKSDSSPQKNVENLSGTSKLEKQKSTGHVTATSTSTSVVDSLDQTERESGELQVETGVQESGSQKNEESIAHHSDRSIENGSDKNVVEGNTKSTSTPLTNLEKSIERVVQGSLLNYIEMKTDEINTALVKTISWDKEKFKKNFKKKANKSKLEEQNKVTVKNVIIKNIRSSNRLISDSSDGDSDSSVELEDPSCLFGDGTNPETEPLIDQMYNMLESIEKEKEETSKKYTEKSVVDTQQAPYVLKEAVIVLEKLSSDKLKYLSTNTKSTQKKKVKSDFNILEYYQHNFHHRLRCLLCQPQSQYHKITAHYVHDHPDSEVLSSRLSPADTKHAILESEIKTVPPNSILCCRFCSFHAENMVIFRDHVSGHTGEFRFCCSRCVFLAENSSGVLTHCQREHQEGADVIELQEVDETATLPGFLCSECHYVQLSKEHIESHVCNVHPGQPSVQILELNMASYIPGQEPIAHDSTYYMRNHQKQNTPKEADTSKESVQSTSQKKKKPGAINNTNAPKRPRGRPRKIPLPSPSTFGSDEPPTKKPRNKKTMQNSPTLMTNVLSEGTLTTQSSGLAFKTVVDINSVAALKAYVNPILTQSPQTGFSLNKPTPASVKKAHSSHSPSITYMPLVPASIKKVHASSSKYPSNLNTKNNTTTLAVSAKNGPSLDKVPPLVLKMSTKKAAKQAPNVDPPNYYMSRRSDDVQCSVCQQWYYGHKVSLVWLQCVVCRRWLHAICTNHEDHCNKCYTAMCG